LPDDATPLAPAEPPHGIAPIAIEDELKRSYLDYAMSVIVSRALPDARDGLKPVHRRILYSMHELGMGPDKGYSKSARVVGDVLGRFHPHGDASVYDALVRMAQDFSMGLPLIDGQGNFGSVDGDPAASMRYTECRMTRAGAALLLDIDKDTVDFQPNYDGREQEPVVLPARVPNLLVNGAGGIAVGMATNIPPHNLGEIVDACLELIDDPALSLERLLEIVPGPDFPTGGEIIGRSGAREALMTGRGSVVIRAKTHVETVRGREAIVVDELPYQVNKKTLQERIAELVRDKRIEGIAHMQDESDRQGMRLVIECRRDASPDVVLNQLHRFTAMQQSFGVNMLALNRGRPEQMGLRALLDLFLEFREEVVVRRTRFELNKARDRGHVLVGLAIAVVNIDEVIAIIRGSPDPSAARERLTTRDWPAGDMTPLINLIQDPRTVVVEGARVRLTDEQARAILALTLARLTGLGRDEIFDEARALSDTIRRLLTILGDRAEVLAIVRAELVEVREQFSAPRRSVMVEGDSDLEDEDLIAREEMVVTVTHGGYVKRTPLATYRTQRRGGRGRSAMATKDEDAVTRVFSASTHAPVLFFSSEGKVYTLKVWRLPVGLPNTKGRSFNNLLPLEAGETITSILPLPEDPSFWERTDVMFATQSGNVRRNKLSDFQRINRAGKIAMKLDEGDHIVGVQLCTEDQDVLLTTALGRCIRFRVDDVRVFAGRTSDGVRGLRLDEGDRVISMAILDSGEITESGEDDEADNGEEAAADLAETGAATALGQLILSVADSGYGKRTPARLYRRTRRGGRGILAHDLSRIGGQLVASFPVEENDELLLITDSNKLIRVEVTPADPNQPSIRVSARKTTGVKIVRIEEGERVVGVERLPASTEGLADEPSEPAEAGPA